MSQVEVGGTVLTITTGELAKQAGGSVLVQYGETIVLGTATMQGPLYEDGDFLPLLVDYEEKFYAAGKIKGSRFVKREGRPSEDATLTARVIDRSIRPLFPDHMINDVQVVLTVLSYDGENDPDIPAMVAASAALSISDVPWSGPIAAVRVGRVDGKCIVNPTEEERDASELDLVVAGTGEQIAMIESGANEVTEEVMLDALEEAQQALRLIVPAIGELAQQVGKEKKEPTFQKHDTEAITKIQDLAREPLAAALAEAKVKQDFKAAEAAGVAAVLEALSDEEKEAINEKQIKHAVHDLRGEMARDKAFSDNWREMGRGFDEIRALHIRAGILPRTHGSAIFQRGETQVLNVATLGGPADVQWLDTMEIEQKKHYIHHYNFPGYSVGENKPSRGPGRREIGHGALAERALIPVLPPRESWPYTMLLVSEVLESNGSSSMASVCGSTLSMMDAGVPLKAPVAGIAMGLFSREENGTIVDHRILTDIAGIEDEKGDMDFKVAGTTEGITALQMDIKVSGLTRSILAEALEQAKQARLELLEAMAAVLPKPRAELSPYAPRIETIQVAVEKIGDLIGPKGKHINEIIEQTGAEIDIDDDGLVSITTNDGDAMAAAKDWVLKMTKEIEVGEKFTGKVVRLMDFGAFVELTPGQDGMVHISQFRDERVENINDVAKVGDTLEVVVTEIDQMGRINLSHKAALPGGTAVPAGNGGRDHGRGALRDKPKGPFKGPKPPR